MKVIALDIGNVCLKVYPDNFFRELGITMDVKYLPLLQVYDSYEKGAFSEDVFFAKLEEYFEEKFTREQFKSALNSVIAEEIPGMAEVVAKFQEAGYKVVFFSDTCPTHLNSIREKLSFFEKIPDQIVSFAVGAKKPSSEMYEAMEQQFCGGSKPVLYLDDLPQNIEAAKARGWNAYLFKSLEEFLEDQDLVDFSG